MKYAKLRGLIREKFGTQEAFAAAANMRPATLSSRLSGRTDWSCSEMETTAKLLGIQPEEVHLYFFAL